MRWITLTVACLSILFAISAAIEQSYISSQIGDADVDTHVHLDLDTSNNEVK